MPAEYQIRLAVGFFNTTWRIFTRDHQGVWNNHLALGTFTSKEDAVFALRQHILQNRSIEESVSYFDADGEEIP